MELDPDDYEALGLGSVWGETVEHLREGVTFLGGRGRATHADARSLGQNNRSKAAETRRRNKERRRELARRTFKEAQAGRLALIANYFKRRDARLKGFEAGGRAAK